MPRSVRSSVCLSVGVSRAVPVNVSGLPPALNATSLVVTTPPSMSRTDGRTCATVDAGEHEIRLVDHERASDAVDGGTRDARIERRRHATSMLSTTAGSPTARAPPRSGR